MPRWLPSCARVKVRPGFGETPEAEAAVESGTYEMVAPQVLYPPALRRVPHLDMCFLHSGVIVGRGCRQASSVSLPPSRGQQFRRRRRRQLALQLPPHTGPLAPCKRRASPPRRANSSEPPPPSSILLIARRPPSIRHRHGNRLRAPTKRAKVKASLGMFIRLLVCWPDIAEGHS